MKRIPEIEGLRGLLALWVFAGHVLAAAGYQESQLPSVARITYAGWCAVQCFIIISGFVIFMMLDMRRETYRTYIVRRFLRLWPILTFATCLEVLLFPLRRDFVLQTAFLAGQSPAELGAIIAQEWHNVWTHLGLHLLMLHGVIPDRILLDAPGALIGPGWSVSLEWQFYLLAPLLYVGLKRSGSRALTVGAAAAAVWLRYKLPEVDHGAFIIFQVEYFALGILSFFIWKNLPPLPPQVITLLIGTAATVGTLFLPQLCRLIYRPYSLEVGRWIPLLLWALFFPLVLATTSPARGLTGLVKRILHSPPLQYLGRISYSLYLCHLPVIWVVGWILLRLHGNWTSGLLLLALSGLCVPLTFALTYVTYTCVESPAIRFGRSLTTPLSLRRG